MTPQPEPWPDRALLAAMIKERFEFLHLDHGFNRRLGASAPVNIVYDLFLMQALTRISVAADLDELVLDVVCSWPDQRMSPADPPPTVTLGEVVAMRAPSLKLPRDLSTEQSAARTLDRSAGLLRIHAIDVLSGGMGLMFDFVDWKRGHGDMGEGRWWGHPIYEEVASVTTARTRTEIRRDLEYEPIHALVHRDPERAWPDIVAFIRRHPGSMEALTLFEDVIDEHGEAFIDRIEELARSDAAFREMVEATHLGGSVGPAIERLEDIEAEVRGER